MSDPKPTRSQGDLAEMLEMLLDKGVVVNADVAVSIGDTELLGIELRAAIASFETAAEYGLEFPTGTDIERVEEAAGVSSTPSDINADTQSQPQSQSQSETDPGNGQSEETPSSVADTSVQGSE